MKIHDLRKETLDGRVRVSATVTWEDTGFPERRIFFETRSEFGDDLHCSPNAFLLAAAGPALHHGERRVLVEGVLCPRLRAGLAIAAEVLRMWFGPAEGRPFSVEASQGFHPPFPAQRPRSASFLSGGVDSLATVYTNRQDYPLEHPGSIRDCFFVHGFDIGGYEHLDRNTESFEFAAGYLSTFARSVQVDLIPVSTNLRYLEGPDAQPDNNLIFTRKSHGAALAAVAHAFSSRITRALIASTNHISSLKPLGSHPLLDPNYSTGAVAIRHDGARFWRSEKLAFISSWEPALKTLRACVNPPPSGAYMNCGKCEKCLRTMTALLICGKLQDCPTYPLDDLRPEHLQAVNFRYHHRDSASLFATVSPKYTHFWEELVPKLENAARSDLAQVITAKLAEQRKYGAAIKQRNKMHALDRRLLGGTLSKLNNLSRSLRRP